MKEALSREPDLDSRLWFLVRSLQDLAYAVEEARLQAASEASDLVPRIERLQLGLTRAESWIGDIRARLQASDRRAA